MRLCPGLTLLQIAADTVQIGSGSRSVQLSGITEVDLHYLDRLERGIPDGEEAEAARSCGIDPARVRRLESALTGFLRQHGQPGPGRESGARGPGHASDVLADDLGLALALDEVADDGSRQSCEGSRDGTTDAAERAARVLEARRALQVQVLGLGRTGATVARVLSASGIGRLALWDRAEVGVADLGTGYLAADLGRHRAVALSLRVDDAGLDTVTLPLTSPTRPRPAGDVTVSVTRGAEDEDFLALARAADHPVLPVVLRDDDVLIGPWLMPGLGGCPTCWDLAARRADPLRVHRQAALIEQQAGHEDVGLATAAGALAARQVVRWAEAGTVAAGSMLRVHGDGSRVDHLTVPAHPDCGCAPLAAAS